MERLRVWLAALVLALPPAAIAISWAVLAPELPDTIATHWSGTDVADGFSATVPTALTLLAITGAMLVVALVLAAVPMGERLRATVLSLLAAVSAMLAAGWVVSAVTTVEAGSAERAVLGPWVLVLLGSAVLLLVPWFLHPREHAGRHRPEAPLALPSAPAATWQGTATAPAFLWLAAALAAGGALLLVLRPTASAAIAVLCGVLLVVAAVVLASLARIHVTADSTGLRVRGAVLGIPLRTIATDRIRVVEALVIEPMEWGGWGYRGLPGRVAIVLRRGPGIVVTMRNGTRFAVTVDDAQDGAATLAAVIDGSRADETRPLPKRPGGA